MQKSVNKSISYLLLPVKRCHGGHIPLQKGSSNNPTFSLVLLAWMTDRSQVATFEFGASFDSLRSAVIGLKVATGDSFQADCFGWLISNHCMADLSPYKGIL